MYITVSCGVAVVTGLSSADDALRAADAAMHRAKDRGRDHVEHFDDQLREEVERRFDLEREIRFALERDELRVLYQPILTVGSARLVGVEALVRWAHPTRGLLRPDEFIPVAEQAASSRRSARTCSRWRCATSSAGAESCRPARASGSR